MNHECRCPAKVLRSGRPAAPWRVDVGVCCRCAHAQLLATSRRRGVTLLSVSDTKTIRNGQHMFLTLLYMLTFQNSTKLLSVFRNTHMRYGDNHNVKPRVYRTAQTSSLEPRTGAAARGVWDKARSQVSFSKEQLNFSLSLVTSSGPVTASQQLLRPELADKSDFKIATISR